MRVLVADDDALTADLLAGYCRKVEPGARVEIAPAGDAARERLSDSAWDLLLLDLDLPGISGRELVALVPDDLPVIIVTGDP
ncbi:MAG: response regulator, partial [Flavobacteriales bacterium]|nr:response regulator [Flavobacteriales bacterium]